MHVDISWWYEVKYSTWVCFGTMRFSGSRCCTGKAHVELWHRMQKYPNSWASRMSGQVHNGSLKPVLHVQQVADGRELLKVQVQTYVSGNTSSKPNFDWDFMCDFVHLSSTCHFLHKIWIWCHPYPNTTIKTVIKFSLLHWRQLK